MSGERGRERESEGVMMAARLCLRGLMAHGSWLTAERSTDPDLRPATRVIVTLAQVMGKDPLPFLKGDNQ